MTLVLPEYNIVDVFHLRHQQRNIAHLTKVIVLSARQKCLSISYSHCTILRRFVVQLKTENCIMSPVLQRFKIVVTYFCYSFVEEQIVLLRQH